VLKNVVIEGAPQTSDAPTDAELALSRMHELSADLVGCAILDGAGRVLAASGEAERWQDAAGSFLTAADEAGDEPVLQAHVATENGEVFALRHGQHAMVAITERFTLSSLVTCDMREILRDLEASTPEETGLGTTARRRVREAADEPVIEEEL
jgi:hypothetical protein